MDILFAEMHELWKTGKLSSVKAANGAAWHGQYSATALNPQKSLKIEHGKKVYFSPCGMYCCVECTCYLQVVISTVICVESYDWRKSTLFRHFLPDGHVFELHL